jgi:hypothetical protein
MHPTSCLIDGKFGIKLIEKSGLNIFFISFFDKYGHIMQDSSCQISVFYPAFAKLPVISVFLIAMIPIPLNFYRISKNNWQSFGNHPKITTFAVPKIDLTRQISEKREDFFRLADIINN